MTYRTYLKVGCCQPYFASGSAGGLVAGGAGGVMVGGGVEGGLDGGGGGGTAIGGVATEIFGFLGVEGGVVTLAPPETDTPPVPDVATGGGGGGGGGSLKKPASVSGMAVYRDSPASKTVLSDNW